MKMAMQQRHEGRGAGHQDQGVRPPGRRGDVPHRGDKEGRVPLHTFRADIDYGFAEANTTFGTIGVKVWVFQGEMYGRREERGRRALVRRP